MAITIIDIPIPNYVRTALASLESAGHEAWLIGPCVRDCLQNMGKPAYEIATGATRDEILRVFGSCNGSVRRGEAGSDPLIVSVGGNTFTVKPYGDGNHRTAESIEGALAGCDFTINALAYHPERGVFDCFGGLDDLQNGIVRAAGDSFTNFRNNPVSILRGCGLASQLGFAIDPRTLQAMIACKMALLRVTPDKLVCKLDELLLGDHVHDALLATIDVLVAVMPEIAACKGFEQKTPYHIYDVWEHTAWVVQRSPATRLSRWAALFHDIGKPAACILEGERTHFYGHPKLSAIMAADIMQRLQFDAAFADQVLTLVKMHDVQIAAAPQTVSEALSEMNGNVDLFKALIQLKRADALAQSNLSEPRLQLSYELEQVLNGLVGAAE